MLVRIIVLFVIVSIAAFVAAFVAIAFSGGGDDDQPAAVTQTAVDGELASCSALADLDSYRYTVAVHIAAKGTPAETPADMTPAPLGALGDALTQLLSDFSLDGAYVNPDRSQALLTFGEDEVELRQIGAQSWVRVGDDWELDDASTDELLTPVLVCNEVIQAVSPTLIEADPADEDANGVASTHYVLDPAKIQNLPPVLGQELEGAYSIDLWVAEDGHFPARLVAQSNDPASDEPAFFLAMDVLDVNDEEISVEAPE